MKSLLPLVLVGFLGCAASLHAQLIAYDGFSGYTAGTINGQGSGFGWTSNWSTAQAGNFTADTTTSLSYDGLAPGTGEIIVSHAPWPGAGVSRTFNPAGSGTLYFGALVRFGDTASVIRMLTLGGTTPGNAGSVMLGQYNGSDMWHAETALQWISTDPISGDSAYRTGNSSGNSVTTSTTYLVAKVVFNTSGTSDSVYFWINPTGASELEDSASADARLINPYDLGELSSAGIYLNTHYGSGASGFAVDEMRIALSSAAMFGAVPEPSTWAAISGAVAVAFAILRRRR